MSNDIPPVALLISHRVADYDAWKQAFDDHKSARVDASCLGHHINRDADDPNMVYVYCPAADVDKAKALVDSPEMAEAMKNAGVEGPPTITLMTPKHSDFIADQKLPGMIVIHAVEDYDAWRAAYDDFDDIRKQHGIAGHAVNQELGKPNQVLVYHQANDMASLRAFIDSTELKEGMERAGVAGPPDIRFVEVSDFAEY
jgi:quinol monooxygenase YgiN